MVEINGKDVRLDTLTPEQRKQLAIKMAGPDHAAGWVQKKNRLRADLRDKPGKETIWKRFIEECLERQKTKGTSGKPAAKLQL